MSRGVLPAVTMGTTSVSVATVGKTNDLFKKIIINIHHCTASQFVCLHSIIILPKKGMIFLTSMVN